MELPANSSATAPPATGASSSVVVVPSKERGVSGTTNYAGNLYSESNALLTYQSAYGQPGSRNWGEWEELLRTDPAVAAGLDFTCGPIRDARVDVEPADDSPLAESIADFVRWNLTQHVEPGFPEFLTQAVKGMLGVGFAMFEPVFKAVRHASLPGGVGYAVGKLPQRLPNTLAINAWNEVDGELKSVRQQGNASDGRFITIELDASEVLLFTWQRNGNNYAGFSAFRPVWYPAKIRRELLRLVGVTYQREGAGVPVMQATDKTAELTPKQRDDMEILLANLVYHENASLIPPAGWTLDWKFSGGANKGHVLDAWHRLGVVILEQVQAQQLALGTGDTGSRAVGSTHDSSSRAFQQSVSAVLESVLNGVGSRPYTGLVRRLVAANWGTEIAEKLSPRLTLTMKQAQLSPLDLLDAVAKGVAAGALTITLKDQNALREKCGLSPLSEEDLAKELDERAARAPKIAPQEPEEDDEEGTQKPQGKPFAARLKASVSRKPWAPWRALRASEAKLDLSAMDKFLASRPEVFERSIRHVVGEMLFKAAPAITATMQDGNVTAEEVALVPLDTARLDAAVGLFLSEIRDEGKRTVRRELRDGDAEALLEQRRVQAAAADGGQEDDDRRAIEKEATDDADEVIEAQRKALVRRMTARLRGELEREAIDVIRTGGDAGEVVSNVITEQLESGAFRSDSLFVTTKAFNTGRDEAARILGGVASVEYSAILDSGTCSPCMSADGQTAGFNSPEHDAMVPPNRDCDGGDRCRCVLVFIPDDGSDE